MSEKAPAFLLYTKDLLSDGNVLAMELDEFGLYIKLLAIYWNEQGLPSDADRLTKMLRTSRENFDRLWPAVAPCFSEKNGRLYQKRLEKERRKQAKHRKTQQLNALARWEKRQCDGNATASNRQSDGNALHLHLQSHLHSQEKKAQSRGVVYAGKRLKVTQGQLDHVVGELGDQAGYVDWLRLLPKWDAELERSGEAFKTLNYLREQGEREIERLRKGGPLYQEAVNDAGEDWFEECKRLHELRCNGRQGHAAQMVIDAGKAS